MGHARGLRVGMVALAMTSMTVLPLSAQEAGAPAADEGAEVEIAISGSTVYAHPESDGVPSGPFGIANPSLLCLFMPCPTEAREVIGLASDPMGSTSDVHGQTAPMQAVPPETIAVSLRGGATQYESAILFDAPSLSDGMQFDDFTLTLTQTDPTFHSSSPTMRKAIDGAFILVRQEDPAAAAAQLQEAVTSEPADQSPMEVRACPLRAAFEPVATPAVAQSADIPRDEFGSVDVACHLGAFGVYDGAGSWSFDLTRAGNAWANGELPNLGLFIQPVATNYLGIGDEDPSTNAQVAFVSTTASLRTQTGEESEGFDFTPPAPAPAVPAATAAAPTTAFPAPAANPFAPAPGVTDSAVPADDLEPVAAPVLTPVVSSGGFAAFTQGDDVSDLALFLALLLIVASGTASYQYVRRSRPRPRRVVQA